MPYSVRCPITGSGGSSIFLIQESITIAGKKELFVLEVFEREAKISQSGRMVERLTQTNGAQVENCMKLAFIAATDGGWKLAEKICRSVPDGVLVRPLQGIRQALESLWQTHDGIICIMATGIVVRSLNGLIQSKYSDPCVVVLDEKGSFAISLLSGHLGGGNKLAEKLAGICGGIPVITTGSDVSGHTSVDLWSIENQLFIINPERLAAVSARLLNRGKLKIFQDKTYLKTLPEDFLVTKERTGADIVISLSPEKAGTALNLLPRIRYIGIGCRRGTPQDEILAALAELQEEGLDLRSVAALASIDIKKDEKALLEISKVMKWPLRFFPREILEAVETPGRSEKVYKKVGTHSVSEASAIRAASCGGLPGHLIIQKRKWKQLTIAVAQRAF